MIIERCIWGFILQKGALMTSKREEKVCYSSVERIKELIKIIHSKEFLTFIFLTYGAASTLQLVFLRGYIGNFHMGISFFSRDYTLTLVLQIIFLGMLLVAGIVLFFRAIYEIIKKSNKWLEILFFIFITFFFLHISGFWTLISDYQNFSLVNIGSFFIRFLIMVTFGALLLFISSYAIKVVNFEELYIAFCKEVIVRDFETYKIIVIMSLAIIMFMSTLMWLAYNFPYKEEPFIIELKTTYDDKPRAFQFDFYNRDFIFVSTGDQRKIINVSSIESMQLISTGKGSKNRWINFIR